MSATIDESGLQIQTLDEITEETSAELEALGFRSDLESSFGQLKRIDGEREAAHQESLQAVYNTLSFFTDGAHLQRVVKLLGVERRPVQSSTVIGTAAGTATTVIPDGTRIRYNPDGSIWQVQGPRTIPGSGSLTDLVVVAETEGAAIEPALDPATGFDDWTILDSVVGFDSFESTAQTIVGAPVETDTSLRERAATEAYRRGQGPLLAIVAAVTAVDGVEYVNVYENRTLVTDADGLPGKSIQVVVDGGAEADIAAAIMASRPAGAELYGLDDGMTFHEVTVAALVGHPVVVRWNDVEDITIHVRATLTTSTAEQEAPANLDELVTDLILAEAAEFGIGDDVLPYKITSAIGTADIPGVDAVVMEVSYDDGGGSPLGYTTNKLAISIRQRSALVEGNVNVVED